MPPPPSPLSLGERQYSSSGESWSATPASTLASSGLAVAVRTPITPRKDKNAGHGARESSALQDPGLKDYRLGECLGKGAFGSVYKAFNWGTGEAVAVKQIKLGDLPKSELRMIESEIELLKNLHVS
jgi:serine/threonine protein kinase